MHAFRTLHNKLKAIIVAGSRAQRSFRRREIILVNTLALLGAGATVAYESFFLIYDPLGLWPMIAVNLGFLTAYIAVPFVNRSGNYLAARNIGIATLIVQLALSTYLAGNAGGLHFFYFLVGGLASMIHSRVRADVTVTLAGLAVGLFLVCHLWFTPENAPLYIPLDIQRKLFIFNTVGALSVCSYFVYVFRSQMYRAERELESANRELAELSGRDALTRLANRRRLDEHYHQQWRQMLRQGQGISVLMMDADRFKEYNDRHGHQAGDECLRRIACLALAAARRPTDLIARYGGEEFIVVLPDTGKEEALGIAENLREAIAQTDMRDESAETPGGERVTVSIGVSSVVPNAESSPEMLISNADRALYQAKVWGRNRVVFCGPDGELSGYAAD